MQYFFMFLSLHDRDGFPGLILTAIAAARATMILTVILTGRNTYVTSFVAETAVLWRGSTT
jgi:hypothetical protein